MNNKERSLWARYAPEPSKPGVSNPVCIDGKVGNKANNNVIRINPSLWQWIEKSVTGWKTLHPGARTWWIGPSDEVKAYQSALAWAVKAHEKRRWTQGEPVRLSILLIGQGIDADGIKAVLDGIQEAGVIVNDNQVAELHIYKIPGDTPRIEINLDSL